LTWHPGGAHILKQVRNLHMSDATPLFESQHALRGPHEMKRKLVPYRVNDTASPHCLYTFHARGFYRVVRKRVTAHLKSLGLTDGGASSTASGAPIHKVKLAAPKGNTYAVLKWSVFMLVFVVLLCASVRATSMATAAVCGFSAGFVMMMASFVLLHDASHFAAFSRSPKTSNFASRFTQTLIGWDHPSWQAHHVLQHHAFTGDTTRDPDLRHGNPFFCSHSEAYDCNPETPTLQFVTALSFIHMGQLTIYHWVWDRKVKRMVTTKDSRTSRNRAAWMGTGREATSLEKSLHGVMDEDWSWWQYALALWPLVVLCAVFRRARAQGLSQCGAATRMLAVFTMALLGANLCYGINIVIDHDSLESVQSLDGHMEPRQSPSDWGEIQVRGTANWAGPVWCFFFGGINYQIEHHLFPTIFHGYYPQIAPIVRATAEEFQIGYVHYDSLSSGLASVLAQMKEAAKAVTNGAVADPTRCRSHSCRTRGCKRALVEQCETKVPFKILTGIQAFAILQWTVLFLSAVLLAKAALTSVMLQSPKTATSTKRRES